MKTSKILGVSTVVIILAIVVYVAFFRKKSGAANETEEKTDVLPDNPLPTIEKAKSEQLPISSDNPIVSERVKQIYRNKQSREDVISAYSVPIALITATGNPSGVQEVLTKSGLGEIPVIPAFISKEYDKQINELLNLRPFETLTYESGFDNAKSIYDKALFFKDFQTGLFPFIQSSADGDAFGKKKRGDDDRSNNISAGIDDFKKLFKQTLIANKDLENALKEEAIKQLRAAGYKVVGYDNIQ